MIVTKYSANGNDFIIFIAQEHKDRSDLARRLCHRQNGVGADGMVVVIPIQITILSGSSTTQMVV